MQRLMVLILFATASYGQALTWHSPACHQYAFGKLSGTVDCEMQAQCGGGCPLNVDAYITLYNCTVPWDIWAISKTISGGVRADAGANGVKQLLGVYYKYWQQDKCPPYGQQGGNDIFTSSGDVLFVC